MKFFSLIIILAIGGGFSDIKGEDKPRKAIVMPDAGPVVKIDVDAILKIDTPFIESFDKEFKRGMEELGAEYAKNQEVHNKNAEMIVKQVMEKEFYFTKVKRAPTKVKEIRTGIPMGTKFPPGKKVIFFDAHDELLSYKMGKLISSIPKEEMPIGFCVNFSNRNDILRFQEVAGYQFLFTAVHNDDIMKEYGLEYYPCIVTVIDSDTCEIQYGL